MGDSPGSLGPPPDAGLLARELAADIEALGEATAAEQRRLRRRWSRRLRDVEADVVLDLAHRVLSNADNARCGVIYELLNHHAAALGSIAAAELAWLGRGIASWGAVDSFACYVAGPVWRERQVPTRLIERWARSPDRWWRRAALASTVALNVAARGGSGDAPRTLRICSILIDDRDDMVVKALSWALRSLAGRAPDAVREFTVRLAPRVRREVVNKLSTGLKQPRRRR
jgi:3-methyladenine DNA glycosylase AlkD